MVVVVVGGRRQRCKYLLGGRWGGQGGLGGGGGGGRGAKAKVHSTFWAVCGVGRVGWVVVVVVVGWRRQRCIVPSGW